MNLEDYTELAGVDVSEFDTYEQYLDSQINDQDMLFLEDETLARALVELGSLTQHRGGQVLSRMEFVMLQKKAKEEAAGPRIQTQKPAAATQRDLTTLSPLLRELAIREDAVRSGRQTVIIFLRGFNSAAKEISGYIDYGFRLKLETFDNYFSGRKKLLPKPSDLSFLNWDSQAMSINSTANFQVITNHPTGLQFKNKRDRKVINVDPKYGLAKKDKNKNPAVGKLKGPKDRQQSVLSVTHRDASPQEIEDEEQDPWRHTTAGDMSTRIPINDPAYEQCIIFVHQTRSRT